jgi:hypothetical protein
MTRAVYNLAGPITLLAFILAGAVTASGQVVASPSSLGYGSVSLGLNDAEAITLTNKGSSAVQVQSITFPFPLEYGIGDGVFPATLSANGGTATYSIVFRPAQAISYNGNITIKFAQGNPLTVAVTGRGSAPLGQASTTATSLSYGGIPLGTTVSRQVTITNVGTASFTVTQINTAAPFSISGFSNSVQVTLIPQASLAFSVSFSPFVVGSNNGAATIVYDSLPAQGIDMTGSGVAPAGLAITSFPTLPEATQTFSYTATLQATGGKPPYTWQITSGSVQGLSFSKTTGIFSGTIGHNVAAGAYNIGVEVRDSSTPYLQVETTVTLPVGVATGAACNVTSIDATGTQLPVVALNDLGTGTYEGQEGGLYPNGSNTNPQQAAGVSIAQQLQPLDANGTPDPTNGTIGVISMGESTTQQPFFKFMPVANADPEKNPKVVFVNGAMGNETAYQLIAPNSSYLSTILNYILPFASVTPLQVEVAWVNASDSDQGGFPGDAELLQGQIESLAQILKTTFPNLVLAYLGSLNYTGYSQGLNTINPEPDSYETAFADKWAIQDQINGDPSLNYNPANGPVLAPWLGWGDYYWANGLLPRSDGTYWSCQDLKSDGVHPSDTTGQLKIAESLLTFLKSDSTATPWFLGSSQ